MEHNIEIHEMLSASERTHFWEELQNYFARDLFPTPHEDLDYFRSQKYMAAVNRLRYRPVNKLTFLVFRENGGDVGFAMAVIYDGEDKRCHIMEYCVYPQFRGQGVGRACFLALRDWAKARDARYFELHAATPEAQTFWASLGFIPNGCDQYGDRLMTQPPEGKSAFYVMQLNPRKDDHFEDVWAMVNSFCLEQGRNTVKEEPMVALLEWAQQNRLTVFLAKRGSRVVGICSVTHWCSMERQALEGQLEALYVKPVFRGQGAEEKLLEAAMDWCREYGFDSLRVRCRPEETPRFTALGFTPEQGDALHCVF